MADLVYSSGALARGMATARWAALTRLGVDVSQVGTWDRYLVRDQRVLVPVDVQALVVPDTAGEATVRFAGREDDPEPFGAATVRDPGVHLHWAMPDALLRARNVQGGSRIDLPRLPDRWVVVRTLLPAGGRLVHVAGWVVDAVKGSVTPLAGFSGETAPTPDGAPVYSTLDGSSGGTLLWSATYDGAVNRFALHDPLTDLPGLGAIAPDGFHGDRAGYTVAGWWTDSQHDPLAAAWHRSQLDDILRGLGWHIAPETPDEADVSPDPRLASLRSGTVLDSPSTSTPTYQVTAYSTDRTRFSDISPEVAKPVADIEAHYVGIRATHYHSLLHGSVLGVPVGGTVSAADDRPAGARTQTSVGADLDDVTAAIAAPAFGVADAQRQSAERLMAAFTSGLLSRVGTPDGIRDIEEHEHADGFWSFAGKALPNARPDRLRGDDSIPLGPTKVGRKGRGAAASGDGLGATAELRTRVSWAKRAGTVRSTATAADVLRSASSASARPAGDPTRARQAERTVERPAPRLFRPAPAIVGVRGLRPNARHHGDGLFDPEGLRCRWPGECRPGMADVVDAAAILPTLGSGAVPDEVLRVVREAVTLDPYASTWLARAGAPEPAWPQLEARVKAEHLRLFGEHLTYDGSGALALGAAATGGAQAAGSAWAATSIARDESAHELAVELAKASLIDGTPPSPVALTTWRQPWVPLVLEWRVKVTGTDTLDGWELGDLDLDRTEDRPATVDRELTGRSPISTSIGRSLSQAMTTWLEAEQARDAATPSRSQLSEPDGRALERLRNLLAPLDLVSASLDGIREQLLGIEYLGGTVRRRAAAQGGTPLPVASQPPVPLFGGEVEVLELRAVDAFGRVLDIPVDTMRTTLSLEVPGRPATIEVRPRVQHGARWLLRLVDPGFDLAGDPAAAPEAHVDQLAGAEAVTPISGYLLPDHMDESMEVFDRFGTPVGELFHDAVSNAVAWEPAPGRPVPPDAGPLTGIPGELGAHAQHVALLAAGLMRRDVLSRHADEPATRSALSAMLRAIDTTLWSVDTYAAIGSPSVAGLVGRPVAVVRATLRLDVPDDLDEVLVTAAGGAPERRSAFEALAAQRFPVRLGDLGRSDDAVLGFFVDDDYTRFHVVDKVVMAVARDSGRHRGHLGLLGTVQAPAVDPLDHPFIAPEDTLLVAPGQVLRLTVLMLPAGKLHLTSGITPRKTLALADDWTRRGLTRMVPSLRVGPVLVDPAEIRMPKVASLGEDQSFIRRTGPLTWRDDPIIAATSSAMLPRTPHEVQEGWIHVAPTDGPGSGS
jgi:hypothetical protein